MKFQSVATALSLAAMASASSDAYSSPPFRNPKMSSERLQRDIKTQK